MTLLLTFSIMLSITFTGTLGSSWVASETKIYTINLVNKNNELKQFVMFKGDGIQFKARQFCSRYNVPRGHCDHLLETVVADIGVLLEEGETNEVGRAEIDLLFNQWRFYSYSPLGVEYYAEEFDTVVIPMDKSDTDIVLARFNEDISWVCDFSGPHFTVYNKGEPLEGCILTHPNVEVVVVPNIGRETETYLNYIIQHYGNLPKTVIFSQASPFDHVPNFRNILKRLLEKTLSVKGYLPFGKMLFVPDWLLQPGAKAGLSEMYFELFTNVWDYDLYFPYGATMAVTKEAISFRPLQFWEKSLSLASRGGTEIETWGFEKAWPVIFDEGLTQ